ncbi:MAG: recombinase RecT [bacterium]
MDQNTLVNLLHMKEDLLDDPAGRLELSATANKVSPVPSSRKAKQVRGKNTTAKLNTYEKLLASAANKLGSTASELSAWLNQISNTPQAVQHNALRLITKYGLDPFADEIAIHQYEDNHWQAFITIDGWSKLINSHPSFSGISFTESDELVGGVPAWMGCAIYRHDRVVPIEVKEYLVEIKTEHSIWKEMPRRMFRHRVIAQCARLAFGVSVPEQSGQKRASGGAGKKVGLNSAARRDSQSSILKAQLKGEVVKN